MEVEQQEVQMNKHPKKKASKLIFSNPAHSVTPLFCSLFVLEDIVQKRFQLRSRLVALLLIASEAMK